MRVRWQSNPGFVPSHARRQDYALLSGSLGMFAMIASTMYLTRKINWHDPKGKFSSAWNRES
ncbi:MAG: inner membrane CreD family protein [Verrucomicrobiota bacterium]|nr:inner membrane CreD family protein [Verrucomicrobiota bacterium]